MLFKTYDEYKMSIHFFYTQFLPNKYQTKNTTFIFEHLLHTAKICSLFSKPFDFFLIHFCIFVFFWGGGGRVDDFRIKYRLISTL